MYRAHRRLIGLGTASTNHWPINRRCANELCAYELLAMLLVKIHHHPPAVKKMEQYVGINSNELCPNIYNRQA